MGNSPHPSHSWLRPLVVLVLVSLCAAYASGALADRPADAKLADSVHPTIPAPPAAPSDLATTAVSRSQINLEWQDNSDDEAGFKVYRDDSLIGVVGPNVTAYQSKWLNCNTRYTYVVKAYNASHVISGPSNASSARTHACPTALPGTPYGLTAVAVCNSEIDLSWERSTDNETGFRIYRDDTLIYDTEESALQCAGSYPDTGLDCGTTYSYAVTAYNAAGESDPSDPAEATTDDCGGVPSAPYGLAATAVSATQIDLSWERGSDDEIGFRIYRDGALLHDTGESLLQCAGYYSDQNLACGTTYEYDVTAYNAVGESTACSPDSATTYACAPQTPAAPSSLAAAAQSQTSIRLTWHDNASNESGYKVYRDWALVQTLGSNATSYTDTGLACGSTHSYILRAYNANGLSSASNIATASAQSCATPTRSPVPPTATCTPQPTLTPTPLPPTATPTWTPTALPTLPPHPTSTPTHTDAPDPGAIHGLVWSDRNGDGVCQAGETYAGVVVGLANSAEAAENALAGTRQVVTNTQGRYRFAGVTSGQYQLTFADPARRIPATSRTIDAAVVETSGVKVDLVYRWVYLAITSRRAP